MKDILWRLDELKKRIQNEDFLKGNGLSNEINIHFFCYEPEDEIVVQYFIEHQIVMDKNIKCNVLEKNLYKIFLKLCEDKKISDKIPIIEQTKGSEFILKSLQGKVAAARNFVREICKDEFNEGDVLLITGVGAVFPFIRSHDVLNAIGPCDLENIPIVVMYPGTFNQTDVKLFNKLPQINYYRAFNIIGKQV